MDDFPRPPFAPQQLLSPYPTTGMVSWPGRPRGGNVKNNDPGPIEPVYVLGHFSFGGTP